MKQDTAAAKLMALLAGAAPDKVAELEEASERTKQQQIRRSGNTEAIPEHLIQEYRQAQGIIYFLQAPELFKSRQCKHCETMFVVSRMYVAYCSYECIRASLNKIGIEWTKGNDLEALAADPNVYERNEPIWLGNLEKLKQALLSIYESLNELPPESLLTTPTSTPHEGSTTSEKTASAPSSLVALMQMRTQTGTTT